MGEILAIWALRFEITSDFCDLEHLVRVVLHILRQWGCKRRTSVQLVSRSGTQPPKECSAWGTRFVGPLLAEHTEMLLGASPTRGTTYRVTGDFCIALTNFPGIKYWHCMTFSFTAHTITQKMITEPNFIIFELFSVISALWLPKQIVPGINWSR